MRGFLGGVFSGPLLFLFLDGPCSGRIVLKRLFDVTVGRLPDFVRVAVDDLLANKQAPGEIPRFQGDRSFEELLPRTLLFGRIVSKSIGTGWSPAAIMFS